MVIYNIKFTSQKKQHNYPYLFAISSLKYDTFKVSEKMLLVQYYSPESLLDLHNFAKI